MKSNSYKLKNFVFFIVLLSFLSCSSDDDLQTGNGEFIIANVETLSFESRSQLQSGPTAAKIDGGQFITFIVQGADDAGNIIAIVVPEYTGPGTYNLGNSIDNFSGSGLFSTQEGEAWSSVIGDGTGSITILTDTDDETTGSFEFVGVSESDGSSRTVTDGAFRVDFEAQ